MNDTEIRNLKTEIQSRENSLAVYEPKLSKIEKEIERQEDEILSLQKAAQINLDNITNLMKRMGREGETYLKEIAPDIFAEVLDREAEEADAGRSPMPP